MSTVNNSTQTKFWIEDPCILVTDLVFFPTIGMTREQKLNALTRLAVAIAIVMYVMEYKHWHTFLLISVLSLVVVEYAAKSKESTGTAGNKEGFTIVPTRIGDDFHETIVAPLFSEEHRIPPPAYELVSDAEFTDIPFEDVIRPQSYPYGQYLTRTNLLPSDEYLTHMNPTGGSKSAREFAANAFTKHEMAFRENMTRIYKKSLQRRFRQNLQDTFSSYHSY